MKTAIFGGSFNPIHLGHLALAQVVVQDTEYEKIIFIPAASPPHKDLAAGASSQNRLEMVRLALVACDWAEVWDGELRRTGASYSIDTIKQLSDEGAITEKPGLIIGDDLADGFTSWKRVNELVDMVEIVLARRDRNAAEFPYPCRRLSNPQWPHSSTEVRQQIRSGGNLAGILPDAVAEYIKEKGLYGIQR